MSSIEERLDKLREERMAREKARIEKLRELNLKKYNKNEPQQSKYSNTLVASSSKNTKPENVTNDIKPRVKNNFHVNNTSKRPVTIPVVNKKLPNKEFGETSNTKPNTAISKAPISKSAKVPIVTKPDGIPKNADQKPTAGGNIKKQTPPRNTLARKSLALPPKSNSAAATAISSRKSVAPPKPQTSQSNSTQSVFERLYKPKIVAKKPTDDVVKIKTDPNFLKNIVKNSGLILNKRHSLFDVQSKNERPVRRSISAVHFKKINKNEINNCIHKWSSIGDKLNEEHLEEINEDEHVNEDKIVSAVKSERKRVKFLTCVPSNFNTPKPEELQARLKNWLQKRGKSLDSYHHLQCFGIHHLAQREVLPIEPPKLDLYDDEDKENIALEHDTDNESYTENMNQECDKDQRDKWRRASYVSDSLELNDTQNSTLTFCDTVQQVDEVLLGALNDLTEMLREGFDWETCARWLRAIRERFPFAPETAAYWECRAALEETRGDLPASVKCWEEAIAKGTERSIVESNLDQLLDKFMLLKISPNSGKRKPVDSKMVDVKNVFKSTIIRFAVQQAKLRRSSSCPTPKYTVTPVRRSSRLSSHWSARKPLQECHSVKQAKQLAPVEFVPNKSLCFTP